MATEEARHLYADNESVSFCADLYQASEGADALVLVTEWKTFRSPDFARLKDQLGDSVIFDGRNIYDPAALEKLGFKYYGIGRSN